jgi:transcriptional regulator with XRE-family HTH domain
MARTAAENQQLRSLGANLRRVRVARGMTQERLAELTNLNPRNIRKIEAGETNVLATTLIRIRKALRCSADQLVPHS